MKASTVLASVTAAATIAVALPTGSPPMQLAERNRDMSGDPQPDGTRVTRSNRDFGVEPDGTRVTRSNRDFGVEPDGTRVTKRGKDQGVEPDGTRVTKRGGNEWAVKPDGTRVTRGD